MRAAMLLSTVYIFFILKIFVLAKASPFLYNPSALPSLISSASASSSAQPISGNIADLRSKKAEKLQEEKTGASDQIDLTVSHKMNEDGNEAAPTLLQKKVNKILGKLRFLAQLSNYGSGPEEPNENSDDFDKEFDVEDKDNVPKKNSSRLELEPPTATVDNLDDTETIDDQPDKITINIETDKIKRESPLGNLAISPGDIGVFFVELFGSLFGLAYGALAQAGQNRPAVTES